MLLSPVFADIHCLAQHHEGRIGEVIVVGAPGGVNYRDADADLRGGGNKWRVSRGRRRFLQENHSHHLLTTMLPVGGDGRGLAMLDSTQETNHTLSLQCSRVPFQL